MKPLEYMRRTWEDYADCYVRLVLFPLPPTPAHGTIYMPDAFTSKTFDLGFDHPKGFRAIHAKPSRWGPAILASIKLRSLISFDPTTGYLSVPHATCCATVSFYVVFRGVNGLQYAGEAQLDRLAMSSRSCHPGSHYSAPMAPFLTTMLQYAQAPEVERKSDDNKDKQFIQIQYATPEEAAAIFPTCDFYRNAWVDRYLGTCVVDPSASYFNTAGGLGEWSRLYLKQLRHNLLRKEIYNEVERTIEIPGDESEEDGGSSHRQRASQRREAARELPEEGRRANSRRGRIIVDRS